MNTEVQRASKKTLETERSASANDEKTPKETVTSVDMSASESHAESDQ